MMYLKESLACASRDDYHCRNGVETDSNTVDLQCVYDTRDVTQNCQEDIDEEVRIAASLEEDT